MQARTQVLRVVRRARGAATEVRLRARPLRVRPDEVGAALGRDPVSALRGPALRALPTVAAFEEGLSSLPAREVTSLLDGAERLCQHEFDLLGSGPTSLGDPIDWHADFKSGRRWPIVHRSRIRLVYPDHSDVKVPWELSRFQHLPLLAAAHKLTKEERYLDEIGAQLRSWIAANPVEFGVNWTCTMDVAIRAANWVAALSICAEEAKGRPWLDEAVASLLLHGRFIRGHLEYGPVRDNHYLANVAGLLPVAALFSGGREGRDWARWAAGELEREMEHQVRADGCAHEASIPYHRLVCELFVCATDAASELVPHWPGRDYAAKLEAMLDFVVDYTQPNGHAPQIGDADDGRFLPLGDYVATDPRCHLHLFRQASRAYRAAKTHAAYRDGGFYVMRGGGLHAVVRCGDTGLTGRGGHGHNDQLSFELASERGGLVLDPGSYVYTADPVARNAFRSTSFHSTLQIDGDEQNEILAGALFRLADRTRAELIRWEPHGEDCLFEARHHGFCGLAHPAVHARRIELSAAARLVVVQDTVTSEGPHLLEWTFPLGQSNARLTPRGVEGEFSGERLAIETSEADFRIESGWYSPSYGVRVNVPFVRASRRMSPGECVTRFELRIEAVDGCSAACPPAAEAGRS